MVQLFWNGVLSFSSILTPIQLGVPGYALNIVATNALVLKHQAISIRNFDQMVIYWTNLKKNVPFMVNPEQHQKLKLYCEKLWLRSLRVYTCNDKFLTSKKHVSFLYLWCSYVINVIFVFT